MDKDRQDSRRESTPRRSRRWLLGGGLAAVGASAAGIGVLLNRTPVQLLESRSRARAIQGDSELPNSADVVIIGGGFVGSCAALTLAERGISVALCEKGVIAGEASGRSMGYVDSQMLDPVKFEIVSRSKALWSQLNSRTGADTGYRPTGLLQALAGPEDQQWAETWLGSINGVPLIDGRVVTGKELSALVPGLQDPPAAALYTPSDASVEPQLAAPAVAEAARRKGAHILQGCAVRGLETRAGRVSAVVTEKGTIACNSVVLAGGAWSSLFLKSLGLSLPQLNVYMSMMGLSAVPGPKIPYSAGSYGFRPQTDGRYTLGGVHFAAPIEPATLANLSRLAPAIRAFWPMASVGFSPSQFWRDLRQPSSWPLDRPSPFEAQRIVEPEFRSGPLEAGLKELQHFFPVFRDARIVDRWSGIVTSTPDNMPVIGAVPDRPGLFVGTAFTFGLTMGPAAGEALADLAMGRTPTIKLQSYRFERFSDGSPITFRG
jgi:glycine/D-amino acid oxidase-like deaminating enzyme